jgi:hypothetical protein
MASRQDIRVFARLPDGSIRLAARYSNQPGWQWVYSGESKVRMLGDIIVNLSEPLPATDAAFADALGFQLGS